MKQLILCLFIFVSVAISAQPVLTFEKHALKADVDNPMTFCSFQEVGASGADVNWDFTSLKALKEFTGHITEAVNTDFALANTELEEFGVKFFYNTSEEGIEHYGYLSKDGRTRIQYDSPFEKMKFPLTYNDAFAKPFSGEYFSNEKSIGQIEGDGLIEADAWGTILLPGNTEYQNTLRVRSEKNYTINFEQSAQNVNMVTYRWYNSAHRYPLLVLIETTVTSGNNSTKSTQAAYNLNAVSSDPLAAENIDAVQKLSIYPNPASNEFTIELTSETSGAISISITDISGREVLPSFNEEVYVGLNKILLKDKIDFMQEGLYLVRINSGGQIVTKELSISK